MLAKKKKATKSIKTSETVSANTDKGLSVYTANCLPCHGEQGANRHNGPNLQESEFAKTYENVVKQVTEGGTTMPSFKDTLSKQEIKEVAKYISDVVAK
ncbi:c-type cytochrome [Rummeliibacillus sp. JY-2-4R]